MLAIEWGLRGQTRPKAGFPPRTQGKSFHKQREGGLHAETAQSALTIIWKLVKGGLISVFLIIITTVTLQLQSQFVPVSLRPDLGSLEVSVTAAV